MILSQIAEQAKQNSNFRQVIATNRLSQIVLMSLLPGEEIGTETHKDNDQILYFIEGSGQAIIAGEETNFSAGDVAVVPAGVEHNFINSGKTSLKLITVYSPSHHPDGAIHPTKADAIAAEAEEHH